MAEVNEFRARAQWCDKKALLVKNPDAKRQLLSAARYWHAIADRNTGSDTTRMNRMMLERHLAKAEDHVSMGEKHVENQRKMLVDLERGGHETVEARKLLKTFEELQDMHIAGRERLRKKLRAYE